MADSDGINGAEPDAGPERRERIDRRLLELLVCPLTKTTLVYDDKAQELISRAAGLAYPIHDGVPLMTVEAARHIDAPRR